MGCLVYDATGRKLQRINALTADTTTYINGIQYTNHHLDFIQTEEGRALNSGGAYSYEYDLRDHLGNVRYSFKENPSTHALDPLQQDDYYAFGLRKVASAGTNNYLYNGKELQDGLGQYDYGARFYDPVIGRFNTIDPLSEGSRRFSPFSYAMNNPIIFIDVDGMYADYYDTDGKYLGNNGVDDKKVYAVNKGDYKTLENGNNIIYKRTELNITHEQFLEKAATVYGESSAYRSKNNGELKKEMFAIASVHEKNNIAYGADSEPSDAFKNVTSSERNGTKMQTAIAAEINAQLGGPDYSKGATNWDGIEQAAFKDTDKRYSTGRFEIHKNTIGWNISNEDYAKWKDFATSKGYAFNAPQISKSAAGVYRRGTKNIPIKAGKIGFTSTAVYGGTIFWKTK